MIDELDSGIYEYLLGECLEVMQKPEETGLPAANVLIYKLDNGETVVVRPSGTEPKIKIYYTTLGKNLEEAEAEKEKLAEALKPIMA